MANVDPICRLFSFRNAFFGNRCFLNYPTICDGLFNKDFKTYISSACLVHTSFINQLLLYQLYIQLSYVRSVVKLVLQRRYSRQAVKWAQTTEYQVLVPANASNRCVCAHLDLQLPTGTWERNEDIMLTVELVCELSIVADNIKVIGPYILLWFYSTDN